jgi:tetratricopeptide (TPR) repeat protein
MVSNGTMRRFWPALVVVSMGCASMPIKPQDAQALADADRRVLSGCYDCLIDARDTYERIAVAKVRPLVVQRLFETQILIVLREIELAIDWQAALARARELGREVTSLPPSKVKDAPPALDVARVLALVDLAPPDDYGWPSMAVQLYRRDRLRVLPKLADELTWLETAPLGAAVRDYLRMTIDCNYGTAAVLGAQRRPRDWKPELAADAPVLLQYRRAMCGEVAAADLEAVRAAVPRFVETSYLLGRLAVAQLQAVGNVARARDEAQAFYARFPQSSSATYLFGAYHQHVGDCRAALPFYDETVALQPGHERALLGRTVCLTYTKQNEEAVAAAGRMIELKTPNVSDAYYWRAWNQRFLQRLPAARADIEQAKSLRAAGEIFTLAGMIEHDQDDLPPAEADLRMALSMSDGSRNCEAGWYLGLVHMKKQEWPAAAAQFDRTMDCYHGRQLENELARRSMERREQLDPEFKARQLASFDAVVRESMSQRSAAAYNAANIYARSGNVDRAKALIEIAALDSTLAARVAELRKILGGG